MTKIRPAVTRIQRLVGRLRHPGRPERSARRIVLSAIAVLAIAGCKGDPVKCDQACRNFAQLVYWKNAEAKIAAAPAGERDEMRKVQAGKFKSDFETGLEMCVSQCQSANNPDDIDCMIAAKNGDQALACFK